MQARLVQLYRLVFFGFFGIFFLMSCNNLFPKKVDAEQWLETESERIDWKKPDVYPLFENCDELAAPASQYNCFTKVYTQNLHTYLSENFAFYHSFSDTLSIELKVDTLGNTFVQKIHHSRFDKVLDSLVRNTQSYLPKIYPARKRDLPVQSKLTVEIILNLK